MKVEGGSRGGPSRWRRVRPRLGAALAVVALAASASACSAGRASLGTTDSPCYVALPTAARAVGQAGHLVGVRLMKVSSLDERAFRSVFQEAGVRSGRVCLVAFKGTFSSGGVSDPAGRAQGRLAVVVLRYPSGSLLATVLFRHLPTRFGHTHFG